MTGQTLIEQAGRNWVGLVAVAGAVGLLTGARLALPGPRLEAIEKRTTQIEADVPAALDSLNEAMKGLKVDMNALAVAECLRTTNAVVRVQLRCSERLK